MKMINKPTCVFLFMVYCMIVTYHAGHAQNQFNAAYRFPNPKPAILPFAPKQKMVINCDSTNFTVGTYIPLGGSETIFVLKTDEDGNVLWVIEYDMPNSIEIAKTLEVSHDKHHIVIVGKQLFNNPQIQDRIIVFKIQKNNGSIVWANEYSIVDEITGIVKRSTAGNDYYVLSGEVIVPATGLIKPAIIAINDADGSLRWSNRYMEGQLNYELNYNHMITGFAVKPGEVALVGKYYNNTNQDRRIAHFKIAPFTGNILLNRMNAYSLEDDPADIAIGSAQKYVWDIARILDLPGDNLNGYAIAGTYITSDAGMLPASEVAVLKINEDAEPAWAKLYDNPNTDIGFGRGVYQNQRASCKLDIFTKHNLLPDLVSGMLTVNTLNGNFIQYIEHNFNGTQGLGGASMNRIPGTDGYLCLAEHITGPNIEDTFQLVAVDNSGSSGTVCETSENLEQVDLETEREIIELVAEPINVVASDCYVSRRLISIGVNFCEELSGDLKTPNKKLAFGPIDCDGIPAIKNEEAGEDLIVFPNPLSTSDNEWQLEYESTGNGVIEIKVSDKMGRIWLLKTVNSTKGKVKTTLIASKIPTGIYIIQIQQNGKLIYQNKLIKE